ncbi:cytochrome P450 [Ceratobasidium sp. AG-I]|nr:cytochrome P450 [Ceratobasidium sp. AG-I]
MDVIAETFSRFATSTWLVLGAGSALIVYRLSKPSNFLSKIPGPSAGNWVTGHFTSIFAPDGISFQEKLVSEYGGTVKLRGAFGEEFIYTIDPAVINAVLVKDKAKYDRAEGDNLMMRSVFGGGLFGISGDEHRFHRKLLNPVFTTKILRERLCILKTPIFVNIAEQTANGIRGELLTENTGSKIVDVFPWMTAAALELLGEAGLGYSFSSFTGERNEYTIAIKSLIGCFFEALPFSLILPYIYNIGTPGFRRWALQYVPIPVVQQLRRAVVIQNRQAQEVLRSRQELISSGVDLTSEPGRGKDVLTLLMKANEAEGSENHIDHRSMIGHLNVFMFAGNETTSTALSRILDILANQPEIQAKLREELRVYYEQRPSGLDHDSLLELPYLDAITRESLRLHGPVTMLSRVNQEDAILPLQFHIDSPAGVISHIPIKKGTRIVISALVANRYERIWGENANEFLPERWVGKKLEEVVQPGGHLPGVYSSMHDVVRGWPDCLHWIQVRIIRDQSYTRHSYKDFKFEPSGDQVNWEANCTYDHNPETVEEGDISLQGLNRLEAKLAELEGLVKAGSSPAGHSASQRTAPSASPPHDPDQYPYNSYDSPPAIPNPSSFPLQSSDWPPTLPPKPLVLHLVDLFFSSHPNARRIIHRPTFLSQLLSPPSSPRFPFIPLINSICAAAAVFSPFVNVVALPDLRRFPVDDVFPEKTRLAEGRERTFDEECFRNSRYASLDCLREGINLFGVAQACVINTWWSWSCGRWLDYWSSCNMAMRVCNMLGFHLRDTPECPLPQKIRDSLLIGPPESNMEAELRRNVFWLAYCAERYFAFIGAWSFDISDEDIQQTLPGTLEAFEAGFDDGQPRQHLLSNDLFTTHGSNLDDFGLYVKGAIMLSRAQNIESRHFRKYNTVEEVRICYEMKAVDAMFTSFRSSIAHMRFSPNNQSLPTVISNLLIVHMVPHLGMTLSHGLLANWADPSCESASKTLSAARSILQYAAGLMESSWDAVRLDRMAGMCWIAAGKPLLQALKHYPESLAPGLRAEIRLIRNSFLVAGGRVIFFLRLRQTLDLDIIDQLGEREAAKVFQEL